MTCRMYDVSHSVIEMFYIKKRSPIIIMTIYHVKEEKLIFVNHRLHRNNRKITSVFKWKAITCRSNTFLCKQGLHVLPY